MDRLKEMLNKIIEGDLAAAQELLVTEMDSRKAEVLAEAKSAVAATIKIQ